MTEEELTKEADEYAIENDVCVCDEEYWTYNDIKQAYLAGAKPREKRIEELEKENTDILALKGLTERQQALIEALKDEVPWKDIKDKSEVIGKLTEAKEIIKDYMIIVKGDHTTVCSVPEENRCINVLKLNEQAEQFLNSEVEK